MIEIVSNAKKSNPSFKVENLLEPFNKIYTSDEYRLECPNALKIAVLGQFKKYVEENPKMFGSPIKDVITIDGMRIIFDGGFALIRQSNTEPVFTLRFEAKTQEECERFQKVMVEKVEDLVKENS